LAILGKTKGSKSICNTGNSVWHPNSTVTLFWDISSGLKCKNKCDDNCAGMFSSQCSSLANEWQTEPVSDNG